MPKVQLGNPPKTFPSKVEFAMVDGTTAEINVQFVYRTRTEFAEFIAGLYPDLKGTSTTKAADGVDVEQLAQAGIDIDVKHILGAVKSWDLEDPVNEASIRMLVDRYPAGAAEMMNRYRIAIVEGRTKN